MRQLWEAKIINGYRTKGKWYNKKKGHTGIDLDYIYEDIPAPCKLHVLKNNVQPGMGNVLYARTDDGVIHVYAHLSKFYHKVDAEIQKGQALGKSGNTGKQSTNAHLHWELLCRSGTNPEMKRDLLPFKGDNVNPNDYLVIYKKNASVNESIPPENGGWISFSGFLKKIRPPNWLK